MSKLGNFRYLRLIWLSGLADMLWAGVGAAAATVMGEPVDAVREMAAATAVREAALTEDTMLYVLHFLE